MFTITFFLPGFKAFFGGSKNFEAFLPKDIHL